MSSQSSPEFDEYARCYDESLQQGLRFSGESKDHFALKRVEWLYEKLGKRNAPSAIMDYGCGTGGAIPCLINQFRPQSVIGIDVSDSSIALARQAFPSTDITFSTPADYTPTGNIDLAFCNGVFHHIPPAERADCVQYIYDALKPGGVFAFWENNPWNPGTRFIMSRVPFDRDAIMLTPPESKSLLQACGFSIERLDFLFIFPRFLSWLRGLERPLSSLPLGGQYLVFAVKEPPIKSGLMKA